ncbi:DUF3145 domain-containing protein [Mariniluteicoccus endophyticus]
MSTTRGVLYVHSAPSALCPHIEWAVGGVLGMRPNFDWLPQPAERSAYRLELSWNGAAGTGASLASALKDWQRIRFEVTEDAHAGSLGSRWSYTPSLGVFHADTGPHGDIVVHEDRLKAAVVGAAMGGRSVEDSIDELLGRPWDSELEVFRHAGDGVPVRWLHEVV